MKKALHWVVVTGTVGLIAGCVQQQYKSDVSSGSPPAHRWTFEPIEIKYQETKSPAWNFQYALEHTAGECRQEADMGYILYSQLRGYGSSKRPDDRAQALSDCQVHATRRGDEAIARLKQSKVSAKTMELSKDLYSKWSVYVSGMTIYGPKDGFAQSQYETSSRALLAEDKFSN